MPLEWSDLNPLTWPDQMGQAWNRLNTSPSAGDEEKRKRMLEEQATRAGAFGNQGETGYRNLGRESREARDYQRRLARGEESVSAEQLRQGLQQNVAAQQSMAAGARPGASGMAARTAMTNAGRMGAGLTGQQAIAGLQERQQANKALTDAILQQRQQDMQVALGSRQNAIGATSAAAAGMPEKSWFEKWGPAIASGLAYGIGGPAGGAAVGAATQNQWSYGGSGSPGAGGGWTYSDERLKHDVKSGAADARRATDSLSAFTFAYKDSKFGKGKQLGVMAQELERAGLKHAVLDTPEGKMVHGAKLATANTAMIAELGKRLAKLEKGKAE